MAEHDPLTKCHQALWTVLEASDEFTAIVPYRLRIKYTDDEGTTPTTTAVRDPEADVRQPDEEAMVAITTAGETTGLRCSSDGTRRTERFQVWIITGDKRYCYTVDGVDKGIFPLRWAILRALADWETTLTALTWNGKVFVHDCRVVQATEQQATPRLKDQGAPAKREGWTLAWQGEVEMWFTSGDLPPSA